MASVQECQAAIEALAGRMGDPGGDPRRHAGFDRTMSCHVPDLDLTFSGELRDGRLVDVSTDPAPPAQIRLRIASDDLVSLVHGQQSFAAAWASGQVKVEASLMDLLRMRSLL